ncbi:MAG: DUF262 domain-containing protein [Sulfuricurvum sp.]
MSILPSDDIENSGENEYESDNVITNPFSTKDISINNRVIALSSLVDRLKYDEIDLNPEFQRNADLWDKSKMSRLIESILLKLPLPIFYFDVSNPDKWIVVDGLQRLSSIKKFMVDNEKRLKLHNLEFLHELDGKSYDNLERGFKRILDETQINTYQIEAQTPKKVRYSIFHRINTGGLVLNAQEIRQALNQGGKGVQFLKDIAESEVFKTIVDLKSNRMSDRELVLRFVAFKLPFYQEFAFNNMGEFLDDSMDKLDKIKDEVLLTNLKKDFLETLEFSEEVLGEGHRFSRSIADEHKTKSLNRSLFDVITVCFSNIENREKFLERKSLFLNKFLELLKDEQSEFTNAITKGTSGKGAVETRFKIMNELIKEVLNED